MKAKNQLAEATKESQQEINNYIAKQIRLIRKRANNGAGYSMKQVANMVGISPTQYEKYETQKTPLRGGAIHAIAEVLGVSAGDLYPANDKTKNLLFLIGQQMRRIEEDTNISIIHAKSAKKTAQDVEKLLLRA